MTPPEDTLIDILIMTETLSHKHQILLRYLQLHCYRHAFHPFNPPCLKINIYCNLTTSASIIYPTRSFTIFIFSDNFRNIKPQTSSTLIVPNPIVITMLLSIFIHPKQATQPLKKSTPLFGFLVLTKCHESNVKT